MTLENNVYEVGLGWMVDEDKQADFIGKEALIRIKAEGVKRKLVGVRIDGDPIALNMTRWPVSTNGKVIGHITSAVFSPRLKANIGYALVSVEDAALDTILMADVPGMGAVPASVVPKPFIDPQKALPRS
jgi:aminomethyltransferase